MDLPAKKYVSAVSSFPLCFLNLDWAKKNECCHYYCWFCFIASRDMDSLILNSQTTVPGRSLSPRDLGPSSENQLVPLHSERLLCPQYPDYDDDDDDGDSNF